MSSLLTVLLATGAAFFYMSASWAMKMWGGSSVFVVVPAVLVILAMGVLFEIEVLKFARLGQVIVMVLALEMVMTFVVSTFFLGERYALREIAGIAIIIAGLMLLNWPQASVEVASEAKSASSRTDIPSSRVERVAG